MTGFSDQLAEANVMAAFVYLRRSGQRHMYSSRVCMDEKCTKLTYQETAHDRGFKSDYSML